MLFDFIFFITKNTIYLYKLSFILIRYIGYDIHINKKEVIYMHDVKATPGDTKWFVNDRFGLFIHWGTYSLAARHEWVKSKEMIDTNTYMKYFDHFDPDLYDPKAWAKAAVDAGIKYFVITAKHHEGFCLWDTDYTDYKATKTPYGKDLLAPMVEAFREAGLKIGFYYSLLDWYHPDYTTDQCHPMRKDPEFIKGDKDRDLTKYRDYLFAQTKELLTRFGKIDILWYDFSVADSAEFKGKGKDVWDSQNLIKMIRELQPDIILDDRLQIDQDIKTPEQYQPREWVKVDGQKVVWEACQTFSGSWGYYRDEYTWKSTEMLIKMLVDSVSKGGNLLLNVGPTGRGEFDDRALIRLKEIGAWMKYNSKSIYGCTQAADEFTTPEDCRLTYDPVKNRLYLHVFNWPFKNIHFDGLAGKIEYAQFLHDASEISYVESIDQTVGINTTMPKKAGTVTFTVPIEKPNIVPVIEIYLKK